MNGKKNIEHLSAYFCGIKMHPGRAGCKGRSHCDIRSGLRAARPTVRSIKRFAVRWHMGGFDESVKGGSFALAHAFEKYPLAVKLHLSDLEATYLHENRSE